MGLSNIKKVLLLLILILISSVFGGAWYVYQNPEGIIHSQLIPPDYYWLDDPNDIYGKTGIVAIAGREFKIPIAYVDGRFKNGRKEDSVVLEYILPEFKSKIEFPKKEDRMKLIMQGRMRGMLLEEAAARPSLDVMTSNLMRNRNFSKTDENIYNLEKHAAPKADGQYALKPDDMFIERGVSGEVTSFLRCSPPGKDKVPGCRHTFINKWLLYRIHWHISELPNWKQQRDMAIDFIDNFEIHTSTPQEKE